MIQININKVDECSQTTDMSVENNPTFFLSKLLSQSRSGAEQFAPKSPSSSELSASPMIDFKRPPIREPEFLFSCEISMPNQMRPILSKYTE